jgi:tetratricopeptide (TPR) repeat protein
LNGRKAEEAQLFEAAVGWYMRGEKAYPADSRFPWALGRLYFEKRLYRLAWDEFRHAETINAYDTTLLYMLSETAAHLNKDREAAAYLERLIAYDPLNIDAIENLGWRYFKIHRSAEGEALLLKAVSEFGANADLEMTLGTIYADLFRYEESKKWYLAAIESSTTGFMGNNAFAAVAHYNLALLEDRFYQFNLAFERTNQSLQTGSRASGRLARGELFVRRMELSAALADCEAAREMDESPLAKVNLADTLRIAGRLEEARRYAEDCLNAQDESWMLNYGLNPVSYRRDLHEILRDCYEGLANTEDFRAASGPLDWLESRARKIRYSFKARVHRLLLRKYSLAEARDYGPQSYSGQTPHLDALKKYYGAFEDYPRRALRYLRESRAFEGPLIPRSGPAYDFEEGKLKGAPRALLETLDRFDPIWERDLLAETYAELSLRFGVKTEEGRDAAERLFALNRGALRQKGIALPAEIDASGAAPRLERTLRGLAKKAGVLQVSLDRAPRYTLTFASAGQNAVQCALRDNVRGRVLFEKTLPLGKGRTERALFSRALGELLFGLE